MAGGLRSRVPLFLALAAGLMALAGCRGTPVGEPCELTSGALGFGFDDPCESRCLALQDVTCPDGSSVREAVCSGREGCDPGSCPEGQACYSFEDPFEKEFYCIPENICPAPPATADERLAWERESRRRSDAIRAKFEKRMKRREASPKETVAPTVEPSGS